MRKGKDGFTLEKEIFQVGIWNGEKYTEKDLDDIITSFDELSEKRDVPLKLGHTDDQKILQREGLAAAGWITALKKVGNKLIATFSNIPEQIKNLIEQKLYKNVSCELWLDYVDKNTGKKYPKILSAVALLGADIPAVAGLSGFYADDYDKNYVVKEYSILENFSAKQTDMAEWDTAYINDLPDSAFAVISAGGKKDDEGKTVPRSLRHLPYKNANGDIDLPHLRNALSRLSQTSISPAEKTKAHAILIKAAKTAGIGDYDNDDAVKAAKKLADDKAAAKKQEEVQMDELKRKFEELEAKTKQLEADNAKLSADVKTGEEAKAHIEKKFAEEKQKIRDTEDKSFIEKFKVDGVIVPAIEKEVTALLSAASDEKVVKFSVKDGEEKDISQRDLLVALVSKLPKLVNLKEFSENGSGKETPKSDVEGSPKSMEFDGLVKKYMAEHKDISYEKAMIEVSIERPELVADDVE